MQGSQEQKDSLIDSMRCPVFEVVEKGNSSWWCLRCCRGPLFWKGDILPRHNANYCFNGLVEESKTWDRQAFLVNHPARKASKGKDLWIHRVCQTFEGSAIKKAQGQVTKTGKNTVKMICNGPEVEEEDQSEEDEDDGAQSE